ncbi:MAG: T9SS type A sorting domain-containing protein [Bacteroidales bacterium]|nr:T9SS type A sorting domain-containing protein [Bacteroidales bacterium]
MKKVAFLLVCVLCGLKCLVANPVPVPSVYINEIMFDSEKGWMLELLCYGEEPSPIVKMTVFSSSGSAESKYLPVGNGEKDEWSQLFVLTRDSMESNLDINPLGDEITVVIEFLRTYKEEPEYFDDVLIFGDFSSSRIAAPLDGQSIGYNGLRYCECDVHYYAKTNEPTLGEYNSISKMYGTLTGKIYDKDNQLVHSNDLMTFARFYSIYSPVPIEDGSYSIQVLANRLNRDYVYISDKKIKIKPFTIDIEPDSIMEQDIYLLEDYTGIAEAPAVPDFPIRIYPNPLSGGQALRYEVGTPVKSLECRMELVSMDGRTMFESKITDHTGTINLPQSLPNGMYIVNFKLNNKIHYSTRLIIGQ